MDYLKNTFECINTSKSDPDIFYCKKIRLNLAIQDCFGRFYGNIDSDKLNDLSKEELVYLILQCENYSVADYDVLKIHGIFKNKYLLPCGCHSFYKSECDHKK